MKVRAHLLQAMIFVAAVGTFVGCDSNNASPEATSEAAAGSNPHPTLPDPADSGFTDQPSHPTAADTATDDDLIVPPPEHDPHICPACGMG